MNGEDLQEFDDASFSRLRRKLLRSKGSTDQRAFLEAVRNDDAFLQVFKDEVVTQGSGKPQLSPEILTENEYKHPPVSTEVALYNAWEGLTPRIACRTTFWANLTCLHIENNRINAAYLAANGNIGSTGIERIDRALSSNGDESSKPIDECVRTVLRRLGGLPEARGNRSVYVDCPFSRAWWRERLVAEVSDGNPDMIPNVREVTRINQTYWEELVVLVVSRNSVLGSRKVRDLFILMLANLISRETNTSLRVANNLRTACRMVGAIQASRELSILDHNELLELLELVVNTHHEQGVE